MSRERSDPVGAAPALDEDDVEEAKDILKRARKERRLQDDASRPLDPWQRYRAQIDLIKEHIDLIDIIDTRVRFGLIIIGAINTAIAVLATRSDALRSVAQPYRGLLLAGVVGMVLLALYFFLLAVEALRPRPIYAANSRVIADAQNRPLGLRVSWDIVARDLAGYNAAWDDARIGEINAELTIQCYGLARVISEKFELVGRMYRGLRIQILLWAVLVVALAVAHNWAPGN